MNTRHAIAALLAALLGTTAALADPAPGNSPPQTSGQRGHMLLSPTEMDGITAGQVDPTGRGIHTAGVATGTLCCGPGAAFFGVVGVADQAAAPVHPGLGLLTSGTTP